MAIRNDRRDVDVGSAEVVVVRAPPADCARRARRECAARERAADEQRVLAVRDLIRLDREHGVAGDVLGPEILVDGARLEVFREERLGLRSGGCGRGGGREDQREEESLSERLRHGGRIRLRVGLVAVSPLIANSR